MIKMVCIKECEAFSDKFFIIPVNKIVDYIDFDSSDGKTMIIFIEKQMTLIDIKDKDKFITLAEWRDNQINNIFSDD